MNTSTYYNLKLVEGTDIVNPLATDVPNYETIDEQMHNNAITGVTLATEVANGTTHALIRENSECAVIRFVATSNWTLGDTITIDGIPVVALLPSGEVLPSGAYIINANVLCILTGTNLTVYAERKKINNATEITYNDTNVKDELDKLNTSLQQTNSNLLGFIGNQIGDTLGMTNGVASYTAQNNEWLCVKTGKASQSPTKVTIHNIPMINIDTDNTVVWYPVKKGDDVNMTCNSNYISYYARYETR